ncbi:MAG: signal peptidase I [Candidatus Hodarchaeota archaeon]
MKHMLPILILSFIVYLSSSLIVPTVFKDEMIFLVNTLLWSVIIAANIGLMKRHSTEIWRTDRTILNYAVITATFQVFLAIFLGFFAGFGRNSMVWSPESISIYFPYLLAPFLGIELSRTYLSRTGILRKPTLSIFLISLYFTFIRTSVPLYQSLASPVLISEFLIKSFIPMLAIDLFATYLAFLGSLPACLTYMSIPTFFSWFSPILPNLSWTIRSVLDAAIPTVGFLLLNQAMPNRLSYFSFGIRRSRKPRLEKSRIPYWTIMSIMSLIVVWSTSGLLGFTPTVVGSDSMTPTLKTGDITFIVSASPGTIRIGDIIQYQTQDFAIIHRVIAIDESGGYLWFTTKGDANVEPDDPVSQRQVLGKAVFTIPEVGWIVIIFKNSMYEVLSSSSSILSQVAEQFEALIFTHGIYMTIVLALMAYLMLYAYRRTRMEAKA